MRRNLTELIDLTLILACMALGCRPREFAFAFLNIKDARIVERIKYAQELREGTVPTIKDTLGNLHPIGALQYELAAKFVKTKNCQIWNLPAELYGQ